MRKEQFSQEELLNFLAEVMTIVEKKDYSLREVYLCSKHNGILKNEVVIGNLAIIGDKTYWKFIDQSFVPTINYTEEQYHAYALSNKRALFLKYSYRCNGSHKYHNKPDKTTEFRLGTNISDFQYLVFALENLYANADAADCYDEAIIMQTLEEISEKIDTYKEMDENNTQNSRDLIKKLNTPKQYIKSQY